MVIAEYILPVTIASCALGSSSYPVGQERAHTPSACPVCPTLCVTALWTLEQQQTCQKKMSRPAEKSKPPTKSNTSEEVKLEAPATPLLTPLSK
jgi:hypothetical protein